MAKSIEQNKARELRKKGESIKEIAQKLKVSPSSVSSWCVEVKLTPKQIKELERHSRDPFYGRRLRYSLKQQKERQEKTKMLTKQSIGEVGILNRRELFLTGVALYWGEGFKKDSQAGLASMDPDIIRLFIKWLTICFKYKIDDLSLRVTVNKSHEYRINEIQEFWSQVTGIPIDKFQKPFYQNFIWKKVYENQNEYFGVLRVKVRKSTDFLRRINGWIEGLRLNAKPDKIA